MLTLVHLKIPFNPNGILFSDITYNRRTAELLRVKTLCKQMEFICAEKRIQSTIKFGRLGKVLNYIYSYTMMIKIENT